MRVPIINFLVLMLALTSCNKPKEPNPTALYYHAEKKETGFTKAERDSAIAIKRATAQKSPIQKMESNSIKLTILPPAPSNSVSEEMSDIIASKAIRLVTDCGVGAMGGDPIFILAITMTDKGTKITETIPQKYVATYDINFYVGNMFTKEVFSSYTISMEGVGSSQDEARMRATDFEPDSQLRNLIGESSSKIIAWYNSHYQELETNVKNLVSLERYDLAYLVLSSVPQEATKCFKMAKEDLPEISKKYKYQQASLYLKGMKDRIAAAKLEYNPEVYAYYVLMPDDCPQKKEADTLFNDYVSSLTKKEQAEIEQRHYLEREQLAISKIQIESELTSNQVLLEKYQAQKQAATSNQKTGFFDKILAGVVSKAVPYLMGFIF